MTLSRNANPSSKLKSCPKCTRFRKETGFEWEEVPGCAALNTPEDADVTKLAKNLSMKNSSKRVGFGTEAGHFQDAGIPTVVCGPGSIDQAHKPDEFVTLEQVALCERFVGRLVDHIST